MSSSTIKEEARRLVERLPKTPPGKICSMKSTFAKR